MNTNTKDFFGGLTIKVSSKMANLKFIECGPTCIKEKGCIAKCCDAPTRENGMLVTILPFEQKTIEKRGGKVIDGLLKPEDECKGCPFKGPDYLCTLHNTPDKPFGCVVSPFKLNKTGLLIVRNRYKMLPCYDPEKGKPAYKIFKSSLELLFGKKETKKLTKHFNSDGGDIFVPIQKEIYDKLVGREAALLGKRAVSRKKLNG